jgi:hypothetical protein
VGFQRGNIFGVVATSDLISYQEHARTRLDQCGCDIGWGKGRTQWNAYCADAQNPQCNRTKFHAIGQ